jgi:integrase
MADRRAKGEGGIYQRKDGRWAGQYVVNTLEGSKRRYVYGKTRKEAAAKLRKAMAERDEGLTFDAGNVTVGAFLDRWLSDSVRDSVRQQTLDSYTQQVQQHIRPALGRVKLKALSAAQVQRFYRMKLDQGLSPRTVQYLHVILHRALRQAVRWGRVSRNVCDAVDPPRPVRKEVQPLTADQARILLKAAKGDRLEALYVLAVTTGLRQGELLGLRWEDVDLDKGVLQVRHALVCSSRNGRLSFAPPKTAKGRRSVSLTPAAVTALEEHRARQADERDAARSWTDMGLVFPSRAGTPLNPKNVLRRSFRPLLKRAGLPHIRFHDLRHTCATLLLLKNVHPKVVQSLLGHATISITLDTYSHVLDGMQDAVIAAMGNVLEGGDDDPNGISP